MITAVENVAKTALPTPFVTRIRPAYQTIGRVRGRALDVATGTSIEVQVNGSTVPIEYPPGFRRYFRDQLAGDTVENCLPTEACVAPDGVDAIFDVGAYTGLYTALLARLNPDIPVYAYEPHGPSRRVCHRTVAVNDASAAVYPLAVAGNGGETDLYVSVEGTQGHSIQPNHDAGEIVSVNSTTIRREIDRHGSAFPFLKIDVEGGEDVVLRDLFDREGAVAGVVELHPDKLADDVDDVLGQLRAACDEVVAHGDSSPNHPASNRIGPGPNRPIYSFRRDA